MSEVRACGALTGKTTKFHKTGEARFMKFCCFPCESAAGRSFQEEKIIQNLAQAEVSRKRRSFKICCRQDFVGGDRVPTPIAGRSFQEEKIIQNLPQAGFE